MNSKALGAEFIGSFAVVSILCGAILFGPGQSDGALASSVAIGIGLLAMTHALIPVSGAHFNPAVTLGLVAGGRFEAGEAMGYIISQLLGAVAATALFVLVFYEGGSGAGAKLAALTNGYGTNGHAALLTTALVEGLFAALFLVVFMGATSRHCAEGSPALAIGLGFAVLYFSALALCSASLNPARSTATALLANPAAFTQLWLFWVAPVTGGIVGGLLGKWLYDE